MFLYQMMIFGDSIICYIGNFMKNATDE